MTGSTPGTGDRRARRADTAVARRVETLISAVTLAGALEGLVLAGRAGLDAGLFLEVALVSSGGSAMLERYGPRVLARQFAAADRPLARWERDLAAALALARRCAVPAPLAAIAHGWLLSAVRRGHGTHDLAALIAPYEELTGGSFAAARPATAHGLRPPAPAENPLRVGFIGLGRIGRPMAACIRRAGFALVVHNRSQGAVDELVRQGAERATSPAAVAQCADVILTCLPDNEAVERVYLGPRGLVEGTRPRQVLVDVGTTALDLTRRLHAAVTARGAVFVDAPVTGGIPAAREGRLTVMVGASEEGFRRASPVLAALAERLFHVGPPGTGQTTKAIGNMLLGTNNAALAEGLALGVAAGLPAEWLLDRLLRSLAASWVMRLRGPMMVRHDFRPLFTVHGRLKDSQAALALGQELHVPLPLAAAAHALYQAAAAGGWGAEDFAAVVKVYERLAGLTALAHPDDERTGR